MTFINPKTDFAFKRIFGSLESQPILISFLNAILYAGNPHIESLEILNPYLAPKILGMKDSYLDVRATLNDSSHVIIEMQVLNVEGLEKRVLYNATKTYSTQLGVGDSYRFLNPVIALTIVDFTLFRNSPEIISRFTLREKNRLTEYLTKDFELVFVELPKFSKPLDSLETLVDQWLYFINHACEIDVVPSNLDNVPEIKQAFEIANQSTLTKEEFIDFERRAMWIQDQVNAIVKAENEGKAAGLREGEKKTRIDNAASLLDILDDKTISERIGLTLEEVRTLRANSKG